MSAGNKVKEMRDQLLSFISCLKTERVLDDSSLSYTIRDALSASKPVGKRVQWQYKTGKIVLNLPIDSVIHPPKAASLTCTLDVAVSGTVGTGEDDWDLLNSQMNLDFSAGSNQETGDFRQFWHLDTHVDAAGSNPPAAVHPKFHMHFGGNRMADRRKSIEKCFGFTLEMAGPRFPHPPMDLVLALDFLLSQVNGEVWRNKLSKMKEYVRPVCNAQHRFWKPYDLLRADFYAQSGKAQREHGALFLLPSLRGNEDK